MKAKSTRKAVRSSTTTVRSETIRSRGQTQDYVSSARAQIARSQRVKQTKITACGPVSVPPKGSLRSWLWVRFLRDVPMSVNEQDVYEARGEIGVETANKLWEWWDKWTAAYQKHVGSQRAGREKRRKMESRKRNYKPVGSYYSGMR